MAAARKKDRNESVRSSRFALPKRAGEQNCNQKRAQLFQVKGLSGEQDGLLSRSVQFVVGKGGSLAALVVCGNSEWWYGRIDG